MLPLRSSFCSKLLLAKSALRKLTMADLLGSSSGSSGKATRARSDTLEAGAEAAAPPAKKSTVKKEGKGGGKSKNKKERGGNDELVQAIGQFVVTVGARLRTLQAVVMVTFLFPRALSYKREENNKMINYALVDEVKVVTSKHFEEVKAMDQQERGEVTPVYLKVWLQILSWIATKLGLMQIDEELTGKELERQNAQQKAHQLITAYMKTIREMPEENREEVLVEHVRHARVGNCYKKELAKLEVTVTMHPDVYRVWSAVRNVLTRDWGFKEKAGPAPKSGLERLIADKISSLQGDEE
eukprot:TRINITY_DN21421_c0_g1_i1.p2 TRINITY_DN21421_c0_g1~~TRINITY_DN21421_c0_g1_i1.p2  ORF type:complete len:298 (-),score=92.44 TRINITY_DN21421_c0_g1_i1:735-1628(-)